MTPGEFARAAGRMVKMPASALALLLTPGLALAQSAAPAAADRLSVAPGGYVPMKPTPGIGMPVDGGIGLQGVAHPAAHGMARQCSPVGLGKGLRQGPLDGYI